LAWDLDSVPWLHQFLYHHWFESLHHHWLPYCSDIKECIEEGGNMSPFVANLIELAPVILYCIVNMSLSMLGVGQPAKGCG
jgi:hypothetical protein